MLARMVGEILKAVKAYTLQSRITSSAIANGRERKMKVEQMYCTKLEDLLVITFDFVFKLQKNIPALGISIFKKLRMIFYMLSLIIDPY